MLDSGRSVNLGHLAIVYLIFGGLCLFTGLFQGIGSDTWSVTQLNVDNTTAGPFETGDAGALVNIEIEKPYGPGAWQLQDARLVDADGAEVLSFGETLRRQQEAVPPDSQSRDIIVYGLQLAVPKEGPVYIELSQDPAATVANATADITVSLVQGGSTPFYVAGLAALIIAGVVFEWNSRVKFQARLRHFA